MFYLAALALGVGFGLSVAILAAATAQGKMVSQSVESMSRQPEVGGRIFTTLILGLAFPEVLVLLTWVIMLQALVRLPTVSPEQLTEMIKSGTAVEKTVAPAPSGALSPTE
jgi:F-type H+-transporting ATPase subunit c